MILYIIQKIPIFRKLYFNKIGRPFIENKIAPIIPFLNANQKILDIGSGNGLVTFLLRQKGLNVTPLDIHEGEYDTSVKPIVYDGKNIPFENKSYDIGIILTVLHHTENPEKIIEEAARVCKQLVIMEDIYYNRFQKYITFFVDRVANLFYSPCPHTNKSDSEWKSTFENMQFKIQAIKYRKVLFYIHQAIYILDVQDQK